MQQIKETALKSLLEKSAWGYRGLQYAVFTDNGETFFFRPAGKINKSDNPQEALKYHDELNTLAYQNNSQLLLSVWYPKKSKALAIGRSHAVNSLHPAFFERIYYSKRK